MPFYIAVGPSVHKLQLSQDEIKHGVSIEISNRPEVRGTLNIGRKRLSKLRSPKNRKFYRKGLKEIRKAQAMNAVRQELEQNRLKMRKLQAAKRNQSKNDVNFIMKAKKINVQKTRFGRAKRSAQFDNKDDLWIDDVEKFNEDEENQDDYEEEITNKRRGGSYRDEERLIRELELQREAEFMNSKDGQGYSSDTTHTAQINEADEFLARQRQMSEYGDGDFIDVVQRMTDESEQKNRDARSQPIIYGNNYMNDGSDEENFYNEYDEYGSYEESY